jgi:gluconolactonase
MLSKMSKLFFGFIFSSGLAIAQTEYGTITLPASLADAGAKVLGVLNKNPTNNVALGYCEGPAADSSGSLFFTEFDSNNDLKSTVWKVTSTGTGSVFYSSLEGTNGMEFDPQGRLVVAHNQAIRRFNADGTRTTLAAMGLNGTMTDLKRTNDLSIGTTGAMYFTNHATGNNVFFMAPDGKVQTFSGFNTPNGIEWIEEKKIVYLTTATKLVKYKANMDGTLSNPVDLANANAGDGLTVDEQGNIYFASWTDGAINVVDSTGKSLGKIVMKSADPADKNQNGNASNCTFGGPGNKTLFITGDGGAYKVQLLVGGRKRPGSAVALLSKEKIGKWKDYSIRQKLTKNFIHQSSQKDIKGRELSPLEFLMP